MMKFALRRTLTNNLGQHRDIGYSPWGQRTRNVDIAGCYTYRGRPLLFEEKEIDRGAPPRWSLSLPRSASVATCAPNPSLTPFNRSSTRDNNLLPPALLPLFWLSLPSPFGGGHVTFLENIAWLVTTRYLLLLIGLIPRSLLILNATPPPFRGFSRYVTTYRNAYEIFL